MPKATILCFLIIGAAAFILSATAKVNHSTSPADLKHREYIPRISPPPPEPVLPEFDEEQEEYLNAHNEFRRMVNVPDLVWDANLTASARNWAKLRRVDCAFRHHSSNKYGESIFYMDYNEFNPKDVVESWFKEHKLYDNLTHQCNCFPIRAGCECGHYLNIIWSNTSRVGCSGRTYCNEQKGVFVVCQYDPPGNLPGVNPFTGKPLRILKRHRPVF